MKLQKLKKIPQIKFITYNKKKTILVLGGILCSLCTQAQEFTVNSSAYSAGNRATAYSMQNRIVTVRRDGILYTYFAYYDLGTLSGTDFAKIAEYNNATGNKSVISVG